MSYARFGWDSSDVYIFRSDSFLECCGCVLQDREWIDVPDSPLGGYLRPAGKEIRTKFDSTKGMVEHLDEHRRAGHTVPDDVVPALWADDAENFPAGAA